MSWKHVVLAGLILAGLGCGGCQIAQSTTEVRSGEQMLDISYENDQARELFRKIVNETEPERWKVRGLGGGPLSVGAHYEELSFNAHCNEHIRKMDTNGDLVITQQEAEMYYQSIESSLARKRG